ncbi:MAG: succinylglutamate desuccinylase [Bacteroidetes bacterium]|nr:MAG: succinylglutamate desuccinylase [Bacteroidota bacterium]
MSTHEPLLIGQTEIAPGQETMVRLPVGRLPTDTRIHMNVWVRRSETPGPHVLFTAGIHGDEANGVEILRRAISTGLFAELQRGAVVVVPVVNIIGFIEQEREAPGGKDVNRSFPGSLSGSLAARMARILTARILPSCHFGVDFHTGGHSHYNYPQVRYTAEHAPSLELAQAFAAPVLLAQKPIPRSLRKVALAAGKPVIVYEGGENLRFDEAAIQCGLDGIRRLLHAYDMLPSAPEPPPVMHARHASWLRAKRAGLFRRHCRAGDEVRKGQLMGALSDPYGMDEIEVFAPHDCRIIGHTNQPVVSHGDALFHLAW